MAEAVDRPGFGMGNAAGVGDDGADAGEFDRDADIWQEC